MSEVTLKPKVTLKRKGESAPFTFDEKFKIEMIWSSETDLDLCLFFKTSDGKVSPIFIKDGSWRSSKEPSLSSARQGLAEIGGTLPRALAISMALISRTRFLESIFLARSGSSFFKISKSFSVFSFSNFARSFLFGGTGGREVWLIRVSI